MSAVDLISFAAKAHPPYFSSGEDVELYNADEEVWEPLRVTRYSISSLANALREKQIDSGAVRFANAEIESYLDHLCNTGIDDKLHHERLMNRRRLVAFADNGYTSVTDFLQTADPLDIARDAGVEEDVVADIASTHVGGFSNASSFGGGGPFQELEPRDDFRGWHLMFETENRIRWSTAGGFQLTLTPTPDSKFAVSCNAPNAERHPWYRKGWSPEIGSGTSSSASNLLQQAHSWLSGNELVFDDDLETFPRIGPVTKDYLALEYGITSERELRQFIAEDRGVFDDIFGKDGERLIEALGDSN